MSSTIAERGFEKHTGYGKHEIISGILSEPSNCGKEVFFETQGLRDQYFPRERLLRFFPRGRVQFSSDSHAAGVPDNFFNKTIKHLLGF
jgi:hypothetical protein